MATDFIAPPTKETTKAVTEANSYLDMMASLRKIAGTDASGYDMFTGKHWTLTPEETPLEQQQAAAPSAAQSVLALTARNPGDGEFRRMYIGNQEFEIWGANRSVLDAKEKDIRELFS